MKTENPTLFSHRKLLVVFLNHQNSLPYRSLHFFFKEVVLYGELSHRNKNAIPIGLGLPLSLLLLVWPFKQLASTLNELPLPL